MTKTIEEKIKSLLERSLKPDVIISKIIIVITEEKYDFKNEEKDKHETMLKKIEKELDNGEIIYISEDKSWYGKHILITRQYGGTVYLSKISSEEGSINLDVNISPTMGKAMMSMCMDSVCNMCEKQTRKFQEMFLKCIDKSKEDIKLNASQIEQKIEARKKGVFGKLIEGIK